MLDEHDFRKKCDEALQALLGSGRCGHGELAAGNIFITLGTSHDSNEKDSRVKPPLLPLHSLSWGRHDYSERVGLIRDSKVVSV